ncbi:replication protein [Proteus sp. fly-1008]|uniref:replication protein n=1 Tax=Proteus sp. fly-1008 TaxID=3136672 RepID=UPI0032DBF108
MSAEIKYLDDFRPEPKVMESKVADLDNGYTRIANELLDAIMLAGLTKHQLLMVMAVWRKTYGFNKKMDWVGNEQLESMTKIDSTKCSTAKNQLVRMKVFIQEGRKIGMNKNISEWETDIYRNSKSFTETVKNSFTKTVKTTLPKRSNTKDNNTKDNKDKIPLTPAGENIALEILDYFNQLTNSKFQSTEPILKALNTIKAKGECYTPDEIKLVMEWAVKTWKNGKDLKPQSLCRMTRFDGYLSDALKWKNRDGINPVDCPHEELIKIWNKYVPERAIDFYEWTSRRPAYKDLEAVWNGKTNKGQWREVKHMDTCFKLISQSSLFTGLQDKGWLTLDWILTPTRWSQTYEQAKREYTERKKGIV